MIAKQMKLIMAIKEVVATPAPAFTPKYAGWTKAQTTTEAVNQLLVQKFKEIIVAYEARKEAKSINDLAKGPFYPNDYAPGLRKHKCNKHLTWLINNNAFRHGLAPKGFDHEKDSSSKTGFAIYSYQIQTDVLPTQALENVKDGDISFFDCGQIQELAIYDTLREITGDIDFNNTFSGIGSNPLKFHIHFTKTPLWNLGFAKEITISDTAQLHFGDLIHFANFRVYNNKHPYGDAGGFNTILISANDAAEKRYAAFGLPVDGKTEEQMNAVLVDELNKKPISLSSIFSGDMLNYVQNAYQNQTALFATQGIDLLNFQVSIHEFNRMRDQSMQQQRYDIGRKPVIRRLDIEAIHKHLAN
jgi:hypothetical protein